MIAVHKTKPNTRGKISLVTFVREPAEARNDKERGREGAAEKEKGAPSLMSHFTPRR